jgi:4-hydroxybenzoate polyprenyltransferase
MVRVAASYFRMLRIEDWIFGYFFIPVIGAVAAAGNPPALQVTAIVSACILAFGFVINNVADVEIDRLHTTKCETDKNPLASRAVSHRGAWLLLLVFALVPVIFSLLNSFAAFLSVTATLAVWAVYSVPPLRLKERYLLDLVTHGIMAGPMLFLVGYTLAGRDLFLFSGKVVSLIVLFACIGCMALLVHQIGDYDQDRGHSTTTVVQIGKKNGWSLLAIFFVLSLVSLMAVAMIVNLESWVFWGSIALFAIPLFQLRNEIRRDFFMPSPDPGKEPGSE